MYFYLGNEEGVVGEWVVDVISFQKIFGLLGLECHKVEIWMDVTVVDDGRTTEHEDRARILEAEFAISFSFSNSLSFATTSFNSKTWKKIATRHSKMCEFCIYTGLRLCLCLCMMLW